MSLEKYKTKRKFDKTPEPPPEPRGKKTAGAKKLRFVVQKHDASRLHYDFRLEMDGVLKSWAVPKGPSLNPEDKRLAMMVEDHPLDYMTFEGVIPEGNYGAGEVIVWDIDAYQPEGNYSSVPEAEKVLLAGLKKGHIDFFLEGKRLNGLFSLIKIKPGSSSKKNNSWLLIKKKDEYASDKDITKTADSVLSGKILKRDVIGKDKNAKEVRRKLSQRSKKVLDRSENARREANNKNLEEVKLTNLDKIYWPKEKYTKGNLIKYYQDVSAIILPYLRNRPQSLNRHPDGIKGENFFQKNFTYKLPEYVETVKIRLETENKTIKSVTCQNIQTLLYLVNLGCVELNPWNSRTQRLDNPDYLILDLDPEDISFDYVVKTALAARKVLDMVGIESFCKTSGKTGLHIYIPLGAKYTNEQARKFAEIIARMINAETSEYTSVARSPKQRQKKVYIDYLQNRHGQTLASAYSVRPWPGATVSTPLKWNEVKKGLDPADFTIKNILKRIDKIGDIWQPVLGQGVDVEQILNKLLNN